jgi:hypothetical protein
MTVAPVVLFVYNRPEHTQKTIESLARNRQAEETILHVCADGPKTAQDEVNVHAVRTYLKSVRGFKDVVVHKEQNNIGCADSIINGVTRLIDEYGKIIVLEDDLVTSEWFLPFMNQALDRYQDVDRVMHVCGTMYPINPHGLPETFFLRHVNSCGWGTWAGAWQLLEPSVEKLVDRFDEADKSYLNLDGAYDFWNHLEKNLTGELRTWAIRWYASVVLNKGLGLYPSISLIENIGFDGTGTHCEKTSKFDVQTRTGPIFEFPDVIEENPLALKRIKRVLWRSEALGVRARRILKNLMSRFLP